MATPTPSTAAQPSSASKKTTDHVTTPSRLGVASPAPRSVPSPAASRKDQAGKTPINHPTASSFGSKTIGGTPMMQSLSQTGHNSSSPGALNGFTPSALGLGVDMGLVTPGQMNISTPLAGGISMMPTMSELGLTGTKRNEDEDRKAKIRRVLKSIGRRKGRASREGLDRIARRVGFETSMSPSDVTFAGKRTLVTIHQQDTVAQDVTTEIFLDDSMTNELKEYQAPIGGVLLRDLSVPHGILLRSSLDRFASNLDGLARMDRLSADVNCFAAVHGLYTSLERLHQLERKAIEGQQHGIAKPKARNEAMRKRSGRPGIHKRGRVGLALDFWSTCECGPQAEQDSSAMDIDDEGRSEQHSADSVSDIFTLQIEAEGCPAAMYPALRVSNAWLPDEFDLPGPDSMNGIPWSDPPPTYLPDTSGAHDTMAMDDTHRLPNLSFVAKLDPPLIMPFSTAMNILQAVGAQLPQIFGQLPQYHAMLLGEKSAGTAQYGVAPGAQADQTVYALRNGEEVQTQHHYSLDVSKPEFAYELKEFPFSHPRQLVELLPTLRQWAHTQALLKNVIVNDSNESQTNDDDGGGSKHLNNLSDAPIHACFDSLDVDIELSTTPQPTFTVIFSDTDVSEVSSIVVQILPNADIVVTNHQGISGEGDDDAEVAKKLAKALAICGDLSIWIEWLRRRKSS